MKLKEEQLQTKEQLLNKLRAYKTSCDDDNIHYKDKVKDSLLKCPELLYAIHNVSLDSELFCSDGTINYDGAWDLYFGRSSNIRPFLHIPQAQEVVDHILCYQMSFDSSPRYNTIEKYCYLTFNIFINGADPIDKLSGIPRHDLVASIIREKFNWSNILGLQCHLIKNKEATMDSAYITRTLVFQATLPNSNIRSSNLQTRVINQMVNK